jgi:hypothetical protein
MEVVVVLSVEFGDLGAGCSRWDDGCRARMDWWHERDVAGVGQVCCGRDDQGVMTELTIASCGYDTDGVGVEFGMEAKKGLRIWAIEGQGGELRMRERWFDLFGHGEERCVVSNNAVINSTSVERFNTLTRRERYENDEVLFYGL